MKGWMMTSTGRRFYPLEPTVEDLDIRDIARGLAMTCRYGGQTARGYYSVAEHCVLVSRHVPEHLAREGLLHDAAEAYIGDMVRPLKYSLPAYRAAEARIMIAVCDRFGLGRDCPAQVKVIDTHILRDERDALMSGAPPLPWVSVEDVEPLGVPIVGYSPAEAKRLFLDRWAELTDATFHASGRMPEPVA